MFKTRAGFLWLALLGLVFSASAQAQWKWRDARGQVLYSDRPPPLTVPEKDILQSPSAVAPRIQIISSQPLGASAPAPAASKPQAKTDAKLEAEEETRRRKAEQDSEAKARAEEQKNAAIRRENCVQARSYLRTLEDGMRISRTNEKGEREILNDAQRTQEIARTRGVINSECSKP
jgi:hypothetical protein